MVGAFYCNGENGWVGQQLYQCRCFVTFQNMNQDRLAGKYVINLLKAALAQFSTVGSLQNLYGDQYTENAKMLKMRKC